MKIGITSYPTVGGSGMVATELGKQLAQRGHGVHFISHRLPFRLREYHDNIHMHEVDHSASALFEYPPYELALAAKMAEVARENDLDLFHVHYAIPHAITAQLAQQMLGKRAPRLVTTLHGTDVTLIGLDRSYFEVTRMGIERSDAVTAVSEFLKKVTLEEFQIERPIEVISDFVDLRESCPSRAYRDPSAFAPNGERILLHVSNLRPVKRVLDVIRILERVVREIPAVLLIVGEGPERAAAQALARRLGVFDRVRFLGRLESAMEVFGVAHVFLLPSELESFGVEALEAMACGVPVVGSDAGGLPEIVRHGETGFLLPVGDVEGMATRTIELLQDDAHRAQLASAGRRRAEALFGAERVVSEYERVYERLLGT
jgi:N-acetyl-alpha-D-glucosaminyl L-malate synthase BshA